MSRSNPTPSNPAKRFFKWKGKTLTYYDKEKQEDVKMVLPFEFLVLDQLATITGWSDQDESSYWSNEVRSVAKEELTVRTSKGVKQTGLYKDMTDVRAKGARYAKSIYIAYMDGNEYVMGNIKASGAALTAWIGFCNRYVVENGKVRLTGSEEAKKGATIYHVPIFEWAHGDEVENDAALKLDRELQMYLTQYLTSRPNVFDRNDDDMQSLIAKGELLGEEELPEGF